MENQISFSIELKSLILYIIIYFKKRFYVFNLDFVFHKSKVNVIEYNRLYITIQIVKLLNKGGIRFV